MDSQENGTLISTSWDFQEEFQNETKWYNLGVSLKISTKELDVIEKDHPNDTSRCVIELHKRLMNLGMKTTWEDIAAALDKIGDCDHATRIRGKYCSRNKQAVSQDVEHLCESEIKIKRHLLKRFDRMHAKYSKLVCDIEEKLINKPVSVNKLQTFLCCHRDLPPLSSNATLSKVFERMCATFCCFYKFDLLENVVEHFLGEDKVLKGDISMYKDCLKTFKKSTKIEKLKRKVNSVLRKQKNSESILIVLKLHDFYDQVVLEKFELFLKGLFNYHYIKVTALLDGSVVVYLTAPRYINLDELLQPFAKSHSFLKSVGVLSLIVDGKVLYEVKSQKTCPETIESALLKAIELNLMPSVEFLLALGAGSDITAKTAITAACQMHGRRGTTLLHIASYYGHLDVVTLTLNAGTDPNTVNYDHVTPLIIASSQGHVDVVRSLLSFGADSNICSLSGITPLMVASEKGITEIISLLIEANAEVHKSTDKGDTALSFAYLSNKPDVISLLLKYHSCDPFSFATTLGLEGILYFLFNVDSNPDTYNFRGITALGMACYLRLTNIASHLLELGVNPNASLNDGVTPLMISCAKGHDELVITLIKGRCSYDLQDESGSTSLHLAVKGQHTSIVSFLLHSGANANITNNEGYTPLMAACEVNSKVIVKLLVHSGTSVDLQNDSGDSAISIASLNGHANIVSILLNSGANPHTANKKGFTPLMLACQNGHEEVVRLLISSGVDINTQNEDGWSVIKIASWNGHTGIVSILLISGANPHTVDKEGFTPLMSACQNGHEKIVNLLISSSVDINAQNEDGSSVINVASFHGHAGIVSILLNSGANPHMANKEGWTPLMSACKNGHEKVVNLLISSGVDINAQNEAGSSVFKIASFHGHADIVSILINSGANPHFADKDSPELHYPPQQQLLSSGWGDPGSFGNLPSVQYPVVPEFGQTAVSSSSVHISGGIPSSLATSSSFYSSGGSSSSCLGLEGTPSVQLFEELPFKSFRGPSSVKSFDSGLVDPPSVKSFEDTPSFQYIEGLPLLEAPESIQSFRGPSSVRSGLGGPPYVQSLGRPPSVQPRSENTSSLHSPENPLSVQYFTGPPTVQSRTHDPPSSQSVQSPLLTSFSRASPSVQRIYSQSVSDPSAVIQSRGDRDKDESDEPAKKKMKL